MATDYDAPRHSQDDDPADPVTDLAGRGTGKNPRAEVEETDTAEGIELPGAVIDEELSVRVLPQQGDEFTCSRCFLVHHRSQLASDTGEKLVCTECAA